VPVKLKLQPFSSTIAQTKSIVFVLSDLDFSKKYRISFENATLDRLAKIISCDNGSIIGDKVIISQVESFSGKLDLNLYDSDSVSVVSIYANVEEYKELEEWGISDIAAFSFQIENSSKKTTGDKISIYPPFVGLEQRATISIQTEPNSTVQIIINSKRFIVKSNFSGLGSFSFRAIDVLGGSSFSSNTLQKFPITYAKSNDEYKEIYDSGSFIHFVPENMKALQSTNSGSTECAILDAEPGEGLTLEKLDKYCIDGAVVGSLSVFDKDTSDFYNSKVGFCTEPEKVYPIEGNDSVCRIFNSTSSSILKDGSGLVVFSSQETFENETQPFPILASRIFVAGTHSSLKYKGNIVRDGSIISPPKFYHTVTPSNVLVNEIYSITFRSDDSSFFEIRYTSLEGTVSEVVSGFVTLINNDFNLSSLGIKAVNQNSFIELKSDNRFAINAVVISGQATLTVALKSNKTLDLITDKNGVNDSGNTVVFLFPKVGYQYHSIVSRDLVNNIIRIEVPSGFNNGIGPDIYENIYCQQFVIVDLTKNASSLSLIDINPLPYIYDTFGREVSCVYPVITTRLIESSKEELAYVVCQAPVDGIYQIFFFSFKIGSPIENTEWKQLTFVGENKNAKIKCDKMGNLHIIWESDRIGPTQLYYSLIGPASKYTSNSVLMAVLDKSIIQNSGVDLVTISDPPNSIQDTWTRVISNNGKVSISDSEFVAIEGSPSEDSAMALYSLSKDEFGNDIPWSFGQLSYQLSFDLLMTLPSTGIMNEKDIESEFSTWKDSFTPVGDYKYEKDGNIYTLDSYSNFYQGIIPICGSYKFNPSNLTVSYGEKTVSEIDHNYPLTYVSLEGAVALSEPSNIRHFMLAMMPEKVRFKAKNIESHTQYCERLGVSSFDCTGFINEVGYEIDTGRYKLALFVSTSDNPSSGSSAKKNYKISRFLSGYIDFKNTKNIKISVHYSKETSDYIEGVSIRENRSISNEYRYSGDIIISVENSIVFATSFLSDFSDQYRKFDIALGFPPGQGITINESVPYKGNMYENGSFKQIFSHINIGSHSIKLNENYVDICKFDRDTSQMVILEKINNIIPNGSFEDTVLPYSSNTELLNGYKGVTGWTSGNSVNYKRLISSDNSVTSWIELTGNSVSSKGYIYRDFPTSIGKEYIVSFDISNHVNIYLQGSSVTKKVRVVANTTSSDFLITSTATEVSALEWQTRSFSFIASSSQTTITFTNSSNQFGDIRDIEYGPQIDNVVVVAESDLNDELSSFTTAENLMVDQSEFDLNYSLNATDKFSQLPITLSLEFQNKNPDIFIDKIDKAHVVWQSNRDNFWNIYYSGFRLRGEPFEFDTRISQSESSSVNPSISVDGRGRRLVSWQDNRSGEYQIYAAISKSIDDKMVDICKQNESDEYVYQWNSLVDPYLDPYVLPISQMNCSVEFTFIPSSSGLYHFNLLFYEDREHTIPYKFINSKSSISGWFVDSNQIPYEGISAEGGSSYVVSYKPSYEDDLSDKVLYVFVEFEINASPVDYNNSTNVIMLRAYSGLNLNISRKEDNSYSSMFEFEGLSPIQVDSQSETSINAGSFNGMIFESPLSKLPGVSIGDKVKSVLLHFDPVGLSGSVSSIIRFTSPISAIFLSNSSLITSKESFGYPGVKYSESSGIELESLDSVTISSDRKTMTILSNINQSVDEIRVLLSDSSSVVGESEFVYYCPSEQSSRCDVKCEFSNNQESNIFVHFRVSFYADAEKTDIIVSSFTKTDTLNWLVGSSSFPVEGLLVDSNQSINAVYSPEIIPFELYESQASLLFSNNISRQPLICGSIYHVVIESYVNDTFYVESESSFVCPCYKTDSDSWDSEKDSISWICSGQGFEDFRISITDNLCLYPKISVTSFDLFYITWQDFRYSRIDKNKSIISSDCFMGIYDSNSNEFICSGQGAYDRRLTNFSSSKLLLHDYSVFVDPFQNINLITHDGNTVYHQSCSLGCELTEISKNVTLPCMFTDETDSSFFVVGGSPDRNVDQYQKIRISDKYVAFSTYVDLQKPITVINDCFLEFDIIGVPGTYAYRLRNDNDQNWSEWLPIGPDIPAQTQTDTNSTKIERDFFKAYFTQRDVFVAPWVVSPGNGTKRVCCEILTFFGKTETFCIDFMAIYDDLEYTIDLFFDSELSQPVPKYKNYMVVSESKTKTIIDESNLTSIKEDIEKISTIYAKIEFKNKNKINIIEKIQSIERFNYINPITISVYQQGLNDQLLIPLTKIKEGIYSGSFSVDKDDGVVNIDGLAMIVVNVPGQCKSVSFEDLSIRASNFDVTNTLDQSVKIFNDFTIFKDKYKTDDVKGSFANPNYYKTKKFGISSIQKPWLE